MIYLWWINFLSTNLLELRRGQRRAGQKTRMVEVLAAEKYASNGGIEAAQPKKQKHWGPAKKKAKTIHIGDNDDPEDINFANGSDSETSTDSSDLEAEHVPTNTEVLFSLLIHIQETSFFLPAGQFSS